MHDYVVVDSIERATHVKVTRCENGVIEEEFIPIELGKELPKVPFVYVVRIDFDYDN